MDEFAYHGNSIETTQVYAFGLWPLTRMQANASANQMNVHKNCLSTHSYIMRLRILVIEPIRISREGISSDQSLIQMSGHRSLQFLMDKNKYDKTIGEHVSRDGIHISMSRCVKAIYRKKTVVFLVMGFRVVVRRFPCSRFECFYQSLNKAN